MYHFPFETAVIVRLEKPSYLAVAKEAQLKKKEKKPHFNLISSISGFLLLRAPF